MVDSEAHEIDLSHFPRMMESLFTIFMEKSPTLHQTRMVSPDRSRARVPAARFLSDCKKWRYANSDAADQEQRRRKETHELREQTLTEWGERWFESGPLPMMAFDRDNLTILAVNEAAIRFYGYSREEFRAMTIKDIRPPEDVPRMLDTLRAGDSGLRGPFIGRHRKKDRTLVDVEVHTQRETLESKTVVLAEIHDVTKYKRAESKFPGLLEVAPDAMALVNPDSIALTVDNATRSEMLQLSQQELVRDRARLQLVLEINNVLVTKLDIRELFTAVSASLRRLTHHLYSQIVLYDAQTRQLVIRAVDFPAGGKGMIHEGLIVPPESPAGAIYRSTQPLLITNLQRDRFPSDMTDRMLAEGVKSVCLVPLVSHDRVLGVLSIGRAEEAAFTQAELETLVAVANPVSIAVENALAFEQIADLNRRLATENLYLDEEVRVNSGFENIIGESAALKDVLKQAEIVAPASTTVLLTGETGTGKELIARDIHDLSERSKAAFIKLNCSAIPTGLLESELFGHEKGAFTGALAQKIGRLELAHRGTLFLDEVGDLPPELQPKLLRVLQDQEFERLGGTKTIHTDVRIVAATNRDLVQMVADLEFREDLYYRLNVFPITIPPLRERVKDIPILVSYFVEKYARQMKKKVATIPQAVMQDLISWRWPGNIRELQNVIERAVILSRGPVLEISLRELTKSSKRDKAAATTLHEADREHILRILRETKGVIGTPLGAAAKLGLKRTTLHAKMRKLGITRRDFMT